MDGLRFERRGQEDYYKVILHIGSTYLFQQPRLAQGGSRNAPGISKRKPRPLGSQPSPLGKAMVSVSTQKNIIFSSI